MAPIFSVVYRLTISNYMNFLLHSISTVSRTSRSADVACVTVTPPLVTRQAKNRPTSSSVNASITRAAHSVRNAVPTSSRRNGAKPQSPASTHANVSRLLQRNITKGLYDTGLDIKESPFCPGQEKIVQG